MAAAALLLVGSSGAMALTSLRIDGLITSST